VRLTVALFAIALGITLLWGTPERTNAQAPARPDATVEVVEIDVTSAEAEEISSALYDLLQFPHDNLPFELGYLAIADSRYAIALWVSEHVAGTSLLYRPETIVDWVLIGGGGGVLPYSAVVEAGVPERVAGPLLAVYRDFLSRDDEE